MQSSFSDTAETLLKRAMLACAMSDACQRHRLVRGKGLSHKFQYLSIASQMRGILMYSCREFHDRLLFGRGFLSFVLPVLKNSSACTRAE